MNAIDFLLNEHTKVRKIIKEINDLSNNPEKQRQKFNELSDNLLRHETMEHEIWYPHFKNNQRLDNTVKHLISEEKHAEKAIKEFENINSHEEWERKFTKLQNNIKHHVEEEETKLFPVIKKIFSEKELEEIGKEMNEFKQQYIYDKNLQ